MKPWMLKFHKKRWHFDNTSQRICNDLFMRNRVSHYLHTYLIVVYRDDRPRMLVKYPKYISLIYI